MGNPEWRLGHDLLADIPLTDYLLSEPRIDLRKEAIRRLGERAVGLGGTERFARSLCRALHRLIGSTRAPDILETLESCVVQVAAANVLPSLAADVGSRSLTSMSLSLSERLTVVRELSNLERWQLEALGKVFDEEVKEFSQLTQTERPQVTRLVAATSLGGPRHLKKLLAIYGIDAPPAELLPPPDLRGAFVPGYHLARRRLETGAMPPELVEQTAPSYSIDTLRAMARSEVPRCNNQTLARLAADTALLSVSLDHSEKLRCLQELPNLDDGRLQQLVDMFQEEAVEFRSLRATEPQMVAALVLGASQGDAELLGLLAKRYEVPLEELDELRSNGIQTVPSVGALESFLGDMPSKQEIAVLPAAGRAWIARSACDVVELHKGQAKLFGCDLIIERFESDLAPSVQSQVGRALLMRALSLLDQEASASALRLAFEPFAKDSRALVREQAARAAVGKAYEIAERDTDPSAYDFVIDLFARDAHPQARERAASAAFNKAYDLAKRDNDPSAYDFVIDLFARDEHPQAREPAASAAFNKANALAKRDNDPSAYDFVIELFARDEHPQARERAAMAAFNNANDLAKRDNDPAAYDFVIDLFAKDEHPQAREQVAMAAFNRANGLAKRDNDPSAYDYVIDLFAKDEHPQARERAARAAFNRANDLAKRDNDPAAYDFVIERFAQDSHPEVRQLVANAAFSRASRLAARDANPSAFMPVLSLLADDTDPKIQSVARECRCARVGWLVVANQSSEAVIEGETLLAETGGKPAEKAVLALLIWLANPTVSHRDRASDLADLLDGGRSDWTFDEFATNIAALEASDRKFANHMIERLEQRP